MLLSERFWLVYFVRVWQKRLFRLIKWKIDGRKYCREKSQQPLPYRECKHQSVLLRILGDTDMRLQQNKVVNIQIASQKISGIIIKPQETFSFWQLVGRATRRKGYKTGMYLSRGEVKEGIGGGICQLSNLIYWMVLHTPLVVTERFRHSFDPFPDSGRVLPFGSGATVFYNYIDLQFCNPTDVTFQINIWFDDKFVHGEIRGDREPTYSYHVFERNHSFIEKEDKYYRSNEIWRNVIDKSTGLTVKQELITKNNSEVKYKL